jgi:hypothetical protein
VVLYLANADEKFKEMVGLDIYLADLHFKP